MPKGNKNPSPSTRWKPGQSGNPMGGMVNPALHFVRRLTRNEIAEIGTMVLESNLDKLKEIFQDKGTSAFKVMFISTILGAIEKKDAYSMAVILEQICGKPTAYVDHSGVIGLAQYRDLTVEQIQEKIVELSRKALEGKTLDVSNEK
jgi:hypothetical protein